MTAVFLICVYLLTNDVEHLFICLLVICMSSLVRLLLRYFAQFLVRLSSYWVIRIFIRYKLFVRYMHCWYFYLNPSLPFHFRKVYWTLCCCGLSKEVFATLTSQLFPIQLFWKLYIFACTFRIINYFMLILKVIFIFFQIYIRLFHHHFLKRLFFSHLITLALLSKNN